MTTESITLQMALDDPAPLDFDAPRASLDARTITCRVHLLPAPANDRGLLLCPDCLNDLAAAALHIAELRETTIDAWLQWLGEQDDAVIEWWRKMEALDEKQFKGKCMLAIAKGGRGAAVVQAWRAKEDTVQRCELAEKEIEGAKS
jgi:hypothetical protein